MTHPAPSVEVIRELIDTFLDTGEQDHLGNAIELAQDLITSGPPEDTMQELHFLIKWISAMGGGAIIPEKIDQAVEDAVQWTFTLEWSNQVATPREGTAAEANRGLNRSDSTMHVTADVEIVQLLSDTFLETGDTDYLDSAIEIAEGIIAGDPAAHSMHFVRSLLVSLYGLKSTRKCSEVDSQAEEEDMTTTSLESNDTLATVMATGGTISKTVIEFLEDLKRFMNQFDSTGDIDGLNKAIVLVELMSLSSTLDITLQAPIFSTFSYLLWIRLERWGDLGDLELAIQAGEQAVRAMTPDYQFKVDIFSNISTIYFARFKRLEEQDDLVKAMQLCCRAVAETSLGDNRREIRLRILWNMLNLRSLVMNLRSTHQDQPVHAGLFESLDPSHPGMFEVIECIANMENMFVQFEEHLASSTVGDHELVLSSFLNGLISYRRRESLGQRNVLENEIRIWGPRAARYPLGGQARPYLMMISGLYVVQKFDLCGDLDDLEKAIKIFQQVVDAIPTCAALHVLATKSLVRCLLGRFMQVGEQGDMMKAIQAMRAVTESTPADHPDRAQRLLHLAILEHEGGFKSLNETIQVAENCVATRSGNDNDHINALQMLCVLLEQRYNRFRDLGDLERGIRVSEEIDNTRPGHPGDRDLVQNYLMHPLLGRFGRYGALDDLERAIQACQCLVTTPGADLHSQAKWLCNLSCTLHNRFATLGEPQDLEKATQLINQAISIAPNNEDRALVLNCSGAISHTRFTHLGDPEDLMNAIRASTMAVATIPSDHQTRICCVTNHIKNLKSRFRLLRDPEDLSNAIEFCDEIISSTSEESDYRARVSLQMIGLLLEGGKANTDRILSISHEVWHNESLEPESRITAALTIATLFQYAGKLAMASVLMVNAVELLPSVSSQFLGRTDRARRLARYFGLASMTMSLCLQVEHSPTDCLSLLEFGRGIIIGSAINCRSDLSELATEYPEICARYNSLRVEIDTPPVEILNMSDQWAGEHIRRRRVAAIDELAESVALIRKLQGFERFQLPQTREQLIAIAREGPIIIVNSTSNRSDVVLVTTTDIKSFILPLMKSSEVEDRMGSLSQMTKCRRSEYPKRNEEMCSLLLWLWNVAVEPIFKELGFDTIDDRKLPHVWWIGVGPLAMAPFHAAGNHFPGSTENTFSRAISSYVPTIKALSYAREKKLKLFRGPETRILLVTMPTTPISSATPETSNRARKWKSLKNAPMEVDQIIDSVQASAITTKFECPDVAQVLDELSATHVIHFACHAVSDAKNPSDSHLLLSGNDNPGPGKLTVGQISDMNLKNAHVAYLSACSTANNSSAALADESIHIASGFLLAGFSHVLATRWDSQDDACLQVAVEFYKRLFDPERQEGDIGHHEVSTAFHHAVKTLRNAFPRQPIRWAPFIHTGA